MGESTTGSTSNEGGELGRRAKQSLSDRISAFLASHSTMSLATTSADGSASVAALFYVHDGDLNLYFLSEMGTVHARNTATRPECAAAIHADLQDWRRISGLQLRGVVSPLPLLRFARVARMYGQKYPFVGPLLDGTIGAQELVGPLRRARFFVFSTHWARFIDNAVGFGSKEELIVDAALSRGADEIHHE